ARISSSDMAISDYSMPSFGCRLNHCPLISPPEIPIDQSIRNELFDMADALIGWTFEFFQTKAGGSKSLVQLHYTPARGPLRLEGRQRPRDLVEAHPIGSLVGCRVGGQFDPAPRNKACDDLGYVTDAIVVSAVADIESLVPHGLGRRLQNGNESPRDILDMDDRTPRRAVGFQIDQSFRDRPRSQVVQNHIEAQARR